MRAICGRPLAMRVGTLENLHRSSHSWTVRAGWACGARRSFHFGTPAYHASLRPVPEVNTKALRESALFHLKTFEPKTWFDKPVVSILDGKRLLKGKRVETVDAFGRVNGAQLLATEEELEAIIKHTVEFEPWPFKDWRQQVRAMEAELLSDHAGALIANQALDFGKQDGVTEIEESLQANAVERRLNDELFAAEERGEVYIPRRVALVSCVSNFTNFLDLSRKVLRNLELGVPVLVLSRTHTQQHAFRWAQTLNELMCKHGVANALFAFCSADRAAQQRLLARAAADAVAACRNARSVHRRATLPPMLVTSGRDVAAAIKAQVPGTIASTGGPNLMLNLCASASLSEAARLSATIEHAGQCTALRVLVAPAAAATEEAMETAFARTRVVESAADALAAGEFAALVAPATSLPPIPDYSTDAKKLVSWRVGSALPSGPSVEEHWRRPVLDVVAPEKDTDLSSPEFLDTLSSWLLRHQPISLAINGKAPDADAANSVPDHYFVARRLFEQTALCVYTVGDAEAPALTAQARPQDGEIFGELPPAKQLATYSTVPMFVPAPQPGYFSKYAPRFLQRKAAEASRLQVATRKDKSAARALHVMCEAAAETELRGYLSVLAEYLRLGASLHRAPGARTALYGLQRPPLGRLTSLRCGTETPLSALLPYLLPFAITNATEQVCVSVHPSNDVLAHSLAALREAAPRLEAVRVLTQTEEQFGARDEQDALYNAIRVLPFEPHAFPLAGHFVTLTMPFGHVKSTRTDDKHFLATFVNSSKWLKCELE